jgi:hypothetical protein
MLRCHYSLSDWPRFKQLRIFIQCWQMCEEMVLTQDWFGIFGKQFCNMSQNLKHQCGCEFLIVSTTFCLKFCASQRSFTIILVLKFNVHFNQVKNSKHKFFSIYNLNIHIETQHICVSIYNKFWLVAKLFLNAVLYSIYFSF